MRLDLRRVMFFTNDVVGLARFYAETFDLAYVGDPADEGWIELDAGGARLAFHRGTPRRIGCKIVFYSSEIPEAHHELGDRGIKVGKIQSFGDISFFDFTDPAGNSVQVSSRP